MATNPNFPPPGPGEPSKERSEQAGESFDADRFGSFRLPSGFFRWAIATPLPKADAEDLWQDTQPPGQLTADLELLGAWPEGALLDAAHGGAPLDREPRSAGRPAGKSRTHLLVFAAVIWGGVIVGSVLMWPFGGQPSSDELTDSAGRSAQPTLVPIPEVEPHAPSVDASQHEMKAPSTQKQAPPLKEVDPSPVLVASSARTAPQAAPAQASTPSASGSSPDPVDSQAPTKKSARRFGLK